MNRTEIELPDDVNASLDHLDLTVEGPNGSVTPVSYTHLTLPTKRIV